MACGGVAATNALSVAAAGRDSDAITGTGGLRYRAVSTTTGTFKVAA